MKRKHIVSLLIAGTCIGVGVIAPTTLNAASLSEELDDFLATEEGKAVINRHTDDSGNQLSYVCSINHSTNIVTVNYSDGYTTTFKFKGNQQETSKDTNTNVNTSNTVMVNNYPVPKYIMETDDVGLNPRELYMKYHGDPAPYDKSTEIGNGNNIPSKIDSNGNAVSMNNSRSKNCWVDGRYYDSEGYNVTGWKCINNQWYYFSGDGVVQKGWKYINKNWYYLDPNNGVMKTGWLQTNGKWYYMNNNGTMKIGWLYAGKNVWYFLDSNGSLAQGWRKIDGTWYYFNNIGVMHTGWLYKGNKWYYLNPNNGAMQTGWLHLTGNRWYYLKSDGSMVSTNFKLKGVYYKVGSDGSCTW